MSEPTYTIHLIVAQYKQSIVAQYKQSRPGEFMPTVVDAWDEYTFEINEEGYQESLAKHRAKEGTDYETMGVRELQVVLPQSAITNLFDPAVITFKENK